MRIRLLCCLPLALLASCESVQTTDGGAVGVSRNQYVLSGLSSAEVDQMAAKSYKEMLADAQSKKVLNTDAAMLKRLRQIASRLEAQVGHFRSDATGWNWEVNLIKSDDLNASCMPGGKIIFFTGIVDKLKLTDDEIAQIMGHEIAHALREHGREAISRSYATQMGTQVIGSLLGLGDVSRQAADMAVQYGLMLPNSRANETEADLIGLELAARAGYKPEAAISLWEKMSSAAQGEPPAFLSTHPTSSGRIQNLQNAIPKVRPLYNAAK